MKKNIYKLNIYNREELEVLNNNFYMKEKSILEQLSLNKIAKVTIILTILNIFIHIFITLSFYIYFNNKYQWLCLLVICGAFNEGKIKNHHQYYRFISSVFLHSSIIHLFCNNCLLLIFGSILENKMDSKILFLLLYILSGLYGNFFTMLIKQDNISIGSSGAIEGILTNVLLYSIYNFQKFSKKLKIIIIGFYFANLILFILFVKDIMNNSYNAGHIGGFFGGLFFGIIFNNFKNDNERIKSIIYNKIYYLSIIYVILLPFISIIILYSKKVNDVTNFIPCI